MMPDSENSVSKHVSQAFQSAWHTVVHPNIY